MKLFLASEAKHPDSFQRLKKYVGGFEGKKIAFIPTASNANAWGEWEKGTTWDLINNVGAEVTPFLLEQLTDLNFPESLKDKDIVWVTGGMCGYLMYWVKRTKLDVCLPELLNNGLLYVGSSAGSMVTAPTLDITDWYVGQNERGASYLPGLGLVDFDFYPHYNEGRLEEIKANVPINKKVYLVKNGEALIVEDDRVTVFGEERIIDTRK